MKLVNANASCYDSSVLRDTQGVIAFAPRAKIDVCDSFCTSVVELSAFCIEDGNRNTFGSSVDVESFFSRDVFRSFDYVFVFWFLVFYFVFLLFGIKAKCRLTLEFDLVTSQRVLWLTPLSVAPNTRRYFRKVSARVVVSLL